MDIYGGASRLGNCWSALFDYLLAHRRQRTNNAVVLNQTISNVRSRLLRSVSVLKHRTAPRRDAGGSIAHSQGMFAAVEARKRVFQQRVKK